MFTNITIPQTVFIVLSLVFLYLLIVGVLYGKSLFHSLVRTTPHPAAQSLNLAAGTPSRPWSKDDLLPPLIDKPADHPVEQAGTYGSEEDGQDLAAFEIPEDEGYTTLLKEAENVVERIQDTVNNIASSPVNPEEVFTKIRSILADYRLFFDTEYFDAINTFVAVTVQRDCDLILSEDDLKALWYHDAA